MLEHWHQRVQRNFLTEVGTVHVASLSIFELQEAIPLIKAQGYITYNYNHIKYLESQSEKQKNKSEVMKANKSFFSWCEMLSGA